MRNLRVNPRHVENTGKRAKCSQKEENAEHADGQDVLFSLGITSFTSFSFRNHVCCFSLLGPGNYVFFQGESRLPLGILTFLGITVRAEFFRINSQSNFSGHVTQYMTRNQLLEHISFMFTELKMTRTDYRKNKGNHFSGHVISTT